MLRFAKRNEDCSQFNDTEVKYKKYHDGYYFFNPNQYKNEIFTFKKKLINNNNLYHFIIKEKKNKTFEQELEGCSC